MHIDAMAVIRHLPGAFTLFAASSLLSPAKERDRNKIPDEYKWDLKELYGSDREWRAQKEKLAGELPELRKFQGTLSSSPSRLAEALETQSRFEKELSRLFSYAFMISDQDTRISSYQAMRQEMIQLGSVMGTETAFIEPEILVIDSATIQLFLSEEPRLNVYRHYLEDIERHRTHTLSKEEEKLLAGASVMASGPGTVYGIFSDADFPYPSVTLSDGTVKLDKANYTLYRSSQNREDRQKVMDAFFSALGKYRATFGSMMNSNVQTALYYAHARHYDTSLEASLDGPNIPVSVYSRLVEGVNRNLATFHRYLKLRMRMMGLPELHYHDLYAPLVSEVDTKYAVAESERNVLAALAPLGSDYAAGTKRAFTERWIDMYPNEGKSSGAYSSGEAYDVHPYMLLNYNGKYEDMSTLAHELGHTMHSYYSNRTQPFPLAAYSIFVAEVASTFNEALLNDYMLKQTKDDATRLSLLGNYLEGIKGTVFRQTQFAEFELRMHEMAGKGQPLTGDALSDLYSEIVKKYYGHNQGTCIVDDYVAHEWAFIPHFYNPFYVFQYATSFTASSALSEKVLSGDAQTTERYLKFLSSGKSKYPIELLKDAGVDMTTDEPLDLTVKKMNRVMDDMERLLDKKRSSVTEHY